jgi:hypothetical protein
MTVIYELCEEVKNIMTKKEESLQKLRETFEKLPYEALLKIKEFLDKLEANNESSNQS